MYRSKDPVDVNEVFRKIKDHGNCRNFFLKGPEKFEPDTGHKSPLDSMLPFPSTFSTFQLFQQKMLDPNNRSCSRGLKGSTLFRSDASCRVDDDERMS